MAAPTFVAASTGATDAGGAWTFTCHAPGAAGRLILFHVLCDGSPTGISFDSATNVEALDGTANTMTLLTSPFLSGLVGSAGSARLGILIGRSTSTSAPTVTGSNSGSVDLFGRFYEFQNGSTGTTLETVIENSVAGSYGNTRDTNGTILDSGVTTLGPDRLALNLAGINDDNTITVFTGQTGGTWSLDAQYTDAAGTDGAIALMTAAMASAGTIGGGSTTNPDATDAWGVIGFALIGTTVVDTRVPYRSRMPQLLAQ